MTTAHAIMTDEQEEAYAGTFPATPVSALVWRTMAGDDDQRSHLRAYLQIGDATIALTALAVHLEGPGIDIGEPARAPFTDKAWRDAPDWTVEFDDESSGFTANEMWQTFGMEGLPDTVEIEGRHYAVFACPMSN